MMTQGQDVPKSLTSEDEIKAFHSLVFENRRVTVKRIEETLKISFVSVYAVLTDVLGMSQLSTRWVPRMLTRDQIQAGLKISRIILVRFQENPANFMDGIVTQDETWVNDFDPESKHQSKQWKRAGFSPPRKFNQSACWQGNGVGIWDCKCILMIDYLQNGQTVTGNSYASELRNSKQAIKQKRHDKVWADVLLLQDDAPTHTSQV